jgi:HSP20 family protein
MNLVPYRHLNLLRDFDDSFGRLLSWPQACTTQANQDSASNWTPRVDIREEEDRLVVSADIPGVDPKDVEVTFEDGVLSVTGERRTESSSSKDGYHRLERSFGKFARHFRLPPTVDADRISAQGKNGVLEVSIPKVEKAKQKRIEIN